MCAPAFYIRSEVNMFVKVPHYLMALGLPSNALKVYLYLLAAKGSKKSITVRYTLLPYP